MTLVYKTSADQFRLAVARVIADQLAKVGIAVTLRSYEFHTVFRDIKRGNYDIATMQTAQISEPIYYHAYFHSSQIPQAPNWLGNNRWRYRNPRIDQLTIRGRSDASRDQRSAIYRDIQERLAQDVPVIPLWHEDNIAVMNSDIHGFAPTPSARLGGLATVTKR